MLSLLSADLSDYQLPEFHLSGEDVSGGAGVSSEGMDERPAVVGRFQLYDDGGRFAAYGVHDEAHVAARCLFHGQRVGASDVEALLRRGDVGRAGGAAAHEEGDGRLGAYLDALEHHGDACRHRQEYGGHAVAEQ